MTTATENAAIKDAAADRRKQLAAQLLRGESVMVTQQGEIRSLSERGSFGQVIAGVRHIAVK